MVVAKATVSLSEDEYISHVVALPQYVVAGLTNNSIVQLPLTLDSNAVTSVCPPPPVNAKHSTTITGMAALPATPMAIITCDSHGHLKTWDLRTRGVQQQIDALDSKLTVTSLGVSNFGEFALGTAANPDAEIHVYDGRQVKSAKALVKYKDSHNDDITDLQFHPTVRNRMLSGSTDGVINLFDISISDEDEAVLEAYNHLASIHRTGFFTDSLTGVKNLHINGDDGGSKAYESLRHDRVFALSHMETLTVFPVDTEMEGTNIPNEDYGDLRERWSCQYVADYLKNHFLIGSNDEKWAGLVPMQSGQPQSVIKLENGHGSEVVRCFDISQASGACFTGGEDGNIKIWDIGGHFDFTTKLSNETLTTSKSGKSKRKTLKASKGANGLSFKKQK